MKLAKDYKAPIDARYAEYLEEEKPALPLKKKKMTKARKMELKRKAEQEFKKLELRDLLRRELELSKKTGKKYRERWESMCRDIKLKDMKEELEEWEKKCNRVIEQKDEKVKLILDEIATTEEMHKNNYSIQLQIMDYLTDILKVFQDNSRLLYEYQVSEILHNFYSEIEGLNEIGNRVKLNCESVVHATNLIVEEEMLRDYQIFLDVRDDRVNTEIEKRYRLRDSIIDKMKYLHKQLLEFQDSSRNVSLDAQKYERVNALMERQRIFVSESQKLDDRELNSSSLHAKLQRVLIQLDTEGKHKISDLKLEHAYFLQMRKNIENEMKLDREQTHEKLKTLTTESFIVLKKYRKLQKYGELLLSLAGNCRKLQTESEKIVPWGDFFESLNKDEDNEPFEMETINLKDHVDITEADLLTNTQLLRNFWRRQALAETQIALMEENKRQLLNEKQNYIEKIKQLSKAENVDDLNKALQVQCALND